MKKQFSFSIFVLIFVLFFANQTALAEVKFLGPNELPEKVRDVLLSSSWPSPGRTNNNDISIDGFVIVQTGETFGGGGPKTEEIKIKSLADGKTYEAMRTLGVVFCAEDGQEGFYGTAYSARDFIAPLAYNAYVEVTKEEKDNYEVTSNYRTCVFAIMTEGEDVRFVGEGYINQASETQILRTLFPGIIVSSGELEAVEKMVTAFVYNEAIKAFPEGGQGLLFDTSRGVKKQKHYLPGEYLDPYVLERLLKFKPRK